MAVEIDKDTITSAAVEADADIRWNAKGAFRGYQPREFPAIIGDATHLAKFFLQLGVMIGEDPENNIDVEDAMEIADSIIEDSMGKQAIFGFPAADVKESL